MIPQGCHMCLKTVWCHCEGLQKPIPPCTLSRSSYWEEDAWEKHSGSVRKKGALAECSGGWRGVSLQRNILSSPPQARRCSWHKDPPTSLRARAPCCGLSLNSASALHALLRGEKQVRRAAKPLFTPPNHSPPQKLQEGGGSQA